MKHVMTIALFACLSTAAIAQPPANDPCASPAAITGNGPFAFDTTNATIEPPGPFAMVCNAPARRDVWFCWTATCDGPVRISTCGQTSADTIIAVYQGCNCPIGPVPEIPPICCNDDETAGLCGVQSEVVCDVVCGQQYMIRIADKGTTPSGVGTFTIECQTPCNGGDPCRRDSIQLNTGYDHNNSAVYPIGSLDSWYQVLADPDAGTTEPRPAGVILKHPAWANPDPQSQWLGAYPGPQALLNGAYVFETCFCLEEGFQGASIVLGARADDQVRVYLNETLNDVLTATATPIHTGDGYNNPTLTMITFNDPTRFVVGENCLKFRVDNLGSVAMGLNALVTVNAPGGHVADPLCCSPGGTISGQKWNDLNGDGIRQTGEPILPGWTINLMPGNLTAVTDTNGFYYFTGLPAGTYTITETNQTGWVQTYPTGGGHTVTLAANTSMGGYDFGNVYRPCATIENGHILCEIDPDGGTTGCYTYTFTLTNNSGSAVHYILIPDANVTPNVIGPFSPPLASGASYTGTVTICPPAGSTSYPLQLVLMDTSNDVCCDITHDVELPDCDCYQFLDGPTVSSNGPGTYNVTLKFQPLAYPIGHVFLAYEPCPGQPAYNVQIIPSYLPVSVPLYGSQVIAFTIITNAPPGTDLCIRMTTHTADIWICCSEMFRIRVNGDGGVICGGDVNGDGNVDLADLAALLSNFGSGGATREQGDLTDDGVVDLSDLAILLAQFGASCG